MIKNLLQYGTALMAAGTLCACSSAPAESAGSIASAAAQTATSPTAVAPPSSTSGVQGSVLLSPGCPGPQIAGRNCDKALANQAIELIDSHGAVVKRTTSASDGSFSMQALAGQYTLQVTRQGLYPRCPVLPVTIVANAMANLMVTCDSGMR